MVMICTERVEKLVDGLSKYMIVGLKNALIKN